MISNRKEASLVAISKLINGLSHFLASLTFKMLQINFRVEKEVEKEDDEVFRDSKDLKEGRRPVYIYLLLLSGYILYLTLGGMGALRI